MAFTPDAQRFAALSSRALATEEMREKLFESDLSEAEVNTFLKDRQAEIWSSAGPEIAASNKAEKDVADLAAKLDWLKTHKGWIVSCFDDVLPGISGLMLLSLFALFSATVRHFVAMGYRYVGGERLAVAVATLISLLALARWIANPIFRRYRTELDETKKALTPLREKAAEQSAKIDPVVLAGIVGQLREFFDTRKPAPFRLDLPDDDSKALSEVPSPRFDIITDARRYVRRLVDRMNGGSIGVAGPRGCGKTTLLRSFCPEGTVAADELTVFATAPVQYDPREFLLQLFTSVCSRVIALETRTEPRSAWVEMDDLRKLSGTHLVDAGIAASVLMVTAMLLLGFGVILLVGAYAPPGGQVKAAAPAASGASAKANPAGPSGSGQSGTNREAGSAENIGPLGIQLCIWGVVFLAAGVILRLGPGQPPASNPLTFFFDPWIRKQGRGPVNPWRKVRELEASLMAFDHNKAQLVERARRTLRGLRFQQSYSSGWSGSLKLPIGLEGGGNAAVTFAERQLGLPEIVHEYREFLEQVAGYYARVFIAIDELDKLPTDEDAKKFLNGIKAIFGQERTFYLVSISENALSSFERRGLPIRDEFDSSFDECVHLKYFDYAASCHLLARRSSQPPPFPYRAFCHAMSGGLPRDLIRSCRKLYDYRRANANAVNDVSTNCSALVYADINAKLSAVRYNLQQIPDEKRTARILQLVSSDSWTPPAIEDAIYALHRAQTDLEEKANGANGADPAGNAAATVNLVEELKAYLYFSLAVISIFQSISGEARHLELESTRVFDKLAVARQLLGVNRMAAIEAINAMVPLPLQPSLPAALQSASSGALQHPAPALQPAVPEQR